MNYEEQLAKAVIARMTEEEQWETLKALSKMDFDEMDRMFEEYGKNFKTLKRLSGKVKNF